MNLTSQAANLPSYVSNLGFKVGNLLTGLNYMASVITNLTREILKHITYVSLSDTLVGNSLGKAAHPSWK